MVVLIKEELKIMIYVCPKCNKQFDKSVKKCPKFGKRLKRQYTKEELEKIQKENDDSLIINTFLM